MILRIAIAAAVLLAPACRSLAAGGGKWASLDIGTHVVGAKVNAKCELTNRGPHRLVIKRIQTSCNCTTAVPTSTVIAPGSAVTLNVAIDSLARAGKFSGQIAVVTDDRNDPVRFIRVTGNFRTLDDHLQCDPPQLIFGRLVAGDRVAQGAVITRRGLTGVGPVKVESSVPWIKAVIEPGRSDERHAFVRLVIGPTDDSSETARGEVMVRGAGGEADMIRLPVIIAGAGRAVGVASRILLEDGKSEYQMPVSGRSSKRGALKSFRTDGGNVEVSKCFELQGKEDTSTIVMQVRPTGTGYLHTRLHLLFEGTTETVSVELTGWQNR